MPSHTEQARLRQLTLLENPPPDPDLEGVAAPQSTPQGQSGPRPLSEAVVGAVKKDKLKRNRRRSKIITNFQDPATDVPIGEQLNDPENRRRKRRGRL